LFVGIPLGLVLLTALAAVAEQYPLGPDSQVQDVPRGMVTHATWTSKIFPGTVRDYWVYVPAQYKAEKPACVMIFQDGGGYASDQSRWRIPVVFDNLIARQEMPVTIGIFINPGFLPPPAKDLPGRPNRSFEYDAVSDRYARFLIEEILPEVGKQYNLSQDPNDRAICGGSSGGICSFTAAWFRPDAFRRVLSFVGSFSNLRGGDAYPSIVRKTETKPIRVFIQSGKKDMNTYAGSWYVQNQAMAGAFEYMGYDYKVVLGEEGHNDIQGGSILPDALRWLWRDWPKPITAPKPPDSRDWATNIVVPDKGWEAVGEGLTSTQALAVDKQGNVYVSDPTSKRIVKLGADGKATPFKENAGTISGMAFGPDGRLYACDGAGERVVAFAADGAETVLATGVKALDLAVDKQGGVYFTEPAQRRVSYVDAKGNKRVAFEGIPSPSGLRLMPGESLLSVADRSGRWAWSLQVQPDGSLTNPEAFYRLEITDETSSIGASGVAVDANSFLYVATTLGIQLGDQEGRTAFIIANPPGGRAQSIAFGGADFQTLYATAGGKVYRRPVQRKGIQP
jgi:enterochelin esterase-like enzyme/sugar lactone lactonase YvrE